MAKVNLPDLTKQQIFADPEYENYECAAGTPQLRKYLTGGKLSKCFAVLSNVSLYCKGECYIQKKRQKRQKRLVDYRIDISDISDVGYVQSRKVWFFILCLLFGLLAPTLVILDRVTGFGETTVLTPLLDAGICALLAVFFALQYSLRKKKLLQFTYSNGTIALDTRNLDPKEELLLVKRLNVLRQGDLAFE